MLRLYAQLYPEMERPAGLDDDAIWDAVAAIPGRTLLLAELEQNVVGTVDVSVVPNLARRADPVLLVENVVVDGSCRRAGVGRALLSAAEGIGRAAGCYKLQLSAADTEACQFYEALGLDRAGTVYKRYFHRS